MYTYQLEVTNVYDGDSITGNIDLGFNLKKENIKIRLEDIDTPEIRTKDLDEKARAYAARDFLRAFLEKYKAGVLVRTTRKGKYGRWIGELLLSEDDFGWDGDMEKYEPCLYNGYYSINEILVQEGHAVRKRY